MKMTLQTIFMLFLIGLAAGLLSGLIGIGGGIIMVPLLIFMGLNQHQAQGTSLAVLSVPVTLLAAANYFKQGYVDWKFAIVMAVFFIIGGYLGSKIAVNLDEKILKKIFGVVLLIVAGKLLIEK